MILQDHFCSLIQKITQLGIIKSVAWHEIVDDPHQCSWVRFEDDAGFVVDIPCTDWGESEAEYTLINLALQKLWNQVGEDANANWILTLDDLKPAVNKARALKPYTGERIANKRMYELGYRAPEYIY